MLRNIYTALRFTGFPDLHMTLRYYPKVDQHFERTLGEAMHHFFEQWPQYRITFPVRLVKPALFGPAKNIPVMLADTSDAPQFMLGRLREIVEFPEDKYEFRPHVTTNETLYRTLWVGSVAIMHQKNVLNDFPITGGRVRDLSRGPSGFRG